MESVKRARSLLGQYPKFVAGCSAEAAAYAKCVAGPMGEVKKDECQAEFKAFKACVDKAVKLAKK